MYRNSLRGSAVCAFKMDDIVASFEGPHKEQKTAHSNWLPAREVDIPDPHPAKVCVKLLSSSMYFVFTSNSSSSRVLVLIVVVVVVVTVCCAVYDEPRPRYYSLVYAHSLGVDTQYWFAIFFVPIVLIFVWFGPKSTGIICHPSLIYLWKFYDNSYNLANTQSYKHM